METETKCECGCGQLIGPRGDHPYFSRQACQHLWQESLFQPEDRRAGWRAEQRHMNELWAITAWRDMPHYEVLNDGYLVSAANFALRQRSTYAERLDDDQVMDAWLLLAHRFAVHQEGDWVSDRRSVPEWIFDQQMRKAMSKHLTPAPS